MIITIDGPAGAGKSTVAKTLAKELGFHFLDTGAMYRAVALAGLRNGVDWDQPRELAKLAERLDIRLDGDRVLLDGQDVSQAIRSAQVTAVTRHAADHPEIRARLIELQRATAAGRDTVTEGRDQGSLAFPDAELKIFLVASAEERARRRVIDFEARGETAALETVLTDINRRDREDTARAVGPLLKADDATEVPTDGLSIPQVVDRLIDLVNQFRPQP